MKGNRVDERSESYVSLFRLPLGSQEREPPSSRDERARRPRVRRANSAITVNLLPTANLEKDSEKAETKTSKLVR